MDKEATVSERLLDRRQLEETFGHVGTNVQVDIAATIIGGKNIVIGSNVRIDCGALLVAGKSILIGDWVHIGAGVQLFASGADVTIEDFCGLSARVTVFSSTDDYSSGYLSNPMVPDKYRRVRSAPVILQRHALIGCGTVIMPGTIVGVGASVGALSFVNKSVPKYVVVSGHPLRRVGLRDGDQLERLEAELRAEYGC